MAFTPVTDGSGTLGPQGMKVVWGTFTNTDGSTGGNVETGFASIIAFVVTPTSHVGTQYPKYTFTTSDGTVTILCSSDVDATWFAVGIGEG